jgi:mannosyltransferase
MSLTRRAPLQKSSSAPLPLRAFALSICILLLAALVRFHNLGAQSFWNDEGNSYVQAARSFADIAANAARDIHPPGYYWLLATWRTLTGDSEFSLRSLSAFASILTVAFTYAIGGRIFSPLAGLAAALFVALNTFSIYYAQEARMYALLVLWAAASIWSLARFLRMWHVRAQRAAPLRWRILTLALVNAAGLWTQYAYPFVMLAQGVVFLAWIIANIRAHRPTGISVGHRAPLQKITRFLIYYIAANLLTITLYLPWLPTAIERVTSWPNTGEPTPFNAALGMILGWFTFGITYTVNDASWVAIGLFLLIFGLRARRNTWQSVVLPLTWAALPVAIFLALGLFRESNLKFLLPSQIGFALLMGRGVWILWTLRISARPAIAKNAPKLAAFAGFLGLIANMWAGLTPLYHDFQRADYRGIVAEISMNLQPDDAVILDAPNQEEVFRYYYRGAAPVYPLPPGLGGNDDETRELVRQIIADHRRIFVVFWGETERDPNRVVESTLDSESYEARSDWYGDVRLVRYMTPVEPTIIRGASARFGEAITLESYALSADSVKPGDVLQLRLTWRTDALLETRYKVFAQLLDSDGVLVTQRDSEPVGGLALTTTWKTGESIIDNHALLIPDNLSPANYTLIIGLYNIDDPQERLPVGEADYLTLGEISVSKNAD